MAPLGFRTRDLCKIALFAVLVISTGVPVQGEPETQVSEKKTPSVKECRAHIDAALEQYWEITQPDEDSHQSKHTDTLEPDASESSKTSSHDELNNHEDDEDDTPISDSDEIETETDIEEDENEPRTDDSQKLERDTEEPEDYNQHEYDEASKDSGEDGNEDDEIEKEEENYEDVEEEEEEEEEDEEEEEKNVTEKKSFEGEERESNIAEEIASDSGDSEEEIEEGDEDHEERKEINEEDKESDSDDADVDNGYVDEDIVEISQDKKNESLQFDSQIFDEQSVDDDSNEEETESEESEEIVEDELTPKEEKDVEEARKVGDELDEEQEEEKDEEKAENEKAFEEGVHDTSDSEIGVQDDKATGESDSAESGVAPELSDKNPSLELPQISKDTEEAPLNEDSPDETGSESPDVDRDLDGDDDELENDEDEDDLGDLDLDDEDERIENIYEEEDEEDILVKPGETFRSRDHVDAILGLDDIGTEYDQNEEILAQSVFKEIKKIQVANVKPMELLYKYADSTTRRLGDAEIFSKPMILFLGPWNTGKTTILNYLLGTERTPEALKTGTGITDVDFSIITHGDQRQVISGTELAADWAYSGVQKFGQGFLEHFRAITFPHALLKKITLVDTPGILENRKNSARGYAFNDAFQWFIDRSDAIYVVLDPTKVDVGSELSSVLDQLKGRDIRFILNKADTIRRSDLMRVVGQLFWNLSPLMSSTEAPVIYAASLSTKPYQPSAPARFLADQENNFLYDLRETLDKRVENKILYARRHAVRVRNHAKMVDCYLSTYYSHKSIFSSKKNVAKLITDNPKEYRIYEGLGSMTNVSRYDLPDASSYREFFKMHPLYDFKSLVSTCSYFRGCPMDKLDMAITKELPELFARYKKAKGTSTLSPSKQDGR